MPTLYSNLSNIRFRGKSFILMGIMIVCFSIIGVVSYKQYSGLDAARNMEEIHDEKAFMTSMIINHIFELYMSLTDIDVKVEEESDERLYIILNRLNEIKQESLSLEKMGGQTPAITKLNAGNRLLEMSVMDLFSFQRQFGLNENKGEQGEMREVIHSIEKILTDAGLDSLLVAVLQIRRREKDVLMRGHKESHARFNSAMALFMTRLAESRKIQDTVRQTVKSDIELYHTLFLKSQKSLQMAQEKTAKIMTVINNMVSQTSQVMQEQRLIMKENVNYQRHLLQTTGAYLFVALLSTFIVLGLLVFLLLQSILIPINILNKNADDIAKGNFATKIALYGRDEIGELADSLKKMKDTMLRHHKELEVKVEQRTLNLNITNSVLEKTISDLNAAQEGLVHSEKMASLGRLVAGFAHEINTPIGIAVSTISHLPMMTHDLDVMLSGDEVEEEEFEQLLNKINQASVLGLSNLRKAADLVGRFKRTSVDQTSEDIREFNLHDVLQDILSSMHNLFKSTQIKISLQCPSGLNIR